MPVLTLGRGGVGRRFVFGPALCEAPAHPIGMTENSVLAAGPTYDMPVQAVSALSPRAAAALKVLLISAQNRRAAAAIERNAS